MPIWNALLVSIAEHYVELNLQHLSADGLARALSTLVVEVAPNRRQRTVNVSVQANLGGTLLAKHMPLLGGFAGAEDGSRAHSQVESVTNPVEVVLAIDISDSMMSDLEGSKRGESRLDIVKRAANALVDILNPNDEGRVAIGVVPWNRAVRLHSDTADDWRRNNWARYATRREYGVPYQCAPELSCTFPEPIMQDVADVAPEPWTGCLDGQRMSSALSTSASVPSSGEFFSLPANNAFAQRYFPPRVGASYLCMEEPLPSDFLRQGCYGGRGASNRWILGAQFGCTFDFPVILPLTRDRTQVEQTIDALSARSGHTYSALGVLWGHRLLEQCLEQRVGRRCASGRSPIRETIVNLRKAIVLLTDGEDTFCGFGNHACSDSRIGVSRPDACDAVKAEGTEIFVVAAMHPDKVSDKFGESLTACSSASDNADGTYVFLNNADRGRTLASNAF